MTRRFFAAGCWVLIVMALVHLLGHYGMMANQGDGDAERQMLSLMRGERQDLGLGMVRSMMDIVAGFSLAFSLLAAGCGLFGLTLVRHEHRAPGLLRQAAVNYAGIFGILTAIALRYWFPAPLAFVAAAFACFAGAAAVGRSEA
jgi:hypothetical protein